MKSSQNLLGGSSVFCAATIHKPSVLPAASVLGFSYMAPVRLLSWTSCGSHLPHFSLSVTTVEIPSPLIPSSTWLLSHLERTPVSPVTGLFLHLHSSLGVYCSMCTQDTLIRCFLALIFCHTSQPPLLHFLYPVSGKGKEG